METWHQDVGCSEMKAMQTIQVVLQSDQISPDFPLSSLVSFVFSAMRVFEKSRNTCLSMCFIRVYKAPLTVAKGVRNKRSLKRVRCFWGTTYACHFVSVLTKFFEHLTKFYIES